MTAASGMVWRVACDQWRLLWRDRIAALALGLLLLLTSVAIFTAWDQRRVVNSERQQRQALFDQQFDAQPDRHPHRMAHYGHIVFRPLNVLAAFDSGVDPYTGNTIFLEAHRQNTATFGDVRQSSLLLRFGQLTPAFVLQLLAPLLLIFVGHACVAREREAGTLRLLMAQGISAGHWLAGKLLALVGVALLMLAPALLALVCMHMLAAAELVPVLMLIAGYTLWLLAWAVCILVVSTCCTRGRDALIALLAVWMLVVVALPRAGADWVSASLALPTRIEGEIALTHERVATADRDNAQDPHFTAFRENLLAQYGVEKVEDLPVNYRALLGLEAERISSALFEKYAQIAYEHQAAQVRHLDRMAWFSPLLAVRRLSLVAAGSDFHEYRRFMEQAEKHRYRFMQTMDQLRLTHMSYEQDNYRNYGQPDARGRISREHWQGMADFRWQPQSSGEILQRTWDKAGILLLWLFALVLMLGWAGRRLTRRAT